MLKRIICFFLALAFIVSGALAEEIFDGSVSAQCAVLYDPLTERVLWSKDCDRRMSIASTTKIMTALLSLEIYKLDTAVKILPEWTGAEGTSMYLKAGEEMTVRDLVYGLMLMSGNDAAVALSNILTGEQGDFIELMNLKAQELGLENTRFENPNGLEGENHYSTARDMALLAAAAMENDEFCEIVMTKNITLAGRYMKNHNKLLTMYPSACGIKTGYTKKAGRCLVSAAEENGRRLIAVTLSAPDDWNDHMRLYDAAFSAMKDTVVFEAGEMGYVPVISGNLDECCVYANEGCTLPMFSGDSAEIVIEGPRMVYAPISSGGKYGTVSVRVNDIEFFSTDLYFQSDAERTAPKQPGFWQRLFERLFNR